MSLKLRDDHVQPRNALQVIIYPALQPVDFQTPSYQSGAGHGRVHREKMAEYWSLYLEGHVQHAAMYVQNNHTSPSFKKELVSSHMNVSKLPEGLIPPGYIQPKTDFGDEKLFNKLKHLLLNPYVSPLLADDLSGLPEAYVFTVQNDVLRDDGIWYALRLKGAGVKVIHRHSNSAFHGIITHAGVLPEATKYAEEVIDYIKKNL